MVFNSSKTGFLNFNSSKAHSILLMGHSTGYSWFCGCPVGFLELDLGIVMRECKDGEDMGRWSLARVVLSVRSVILLRSHPFHSFPT
jgi:hypothetical protein